MALTQDDPAALALRINLGGYGQSICWAPSPEVCVSFVPEYSLGYGFTSTGRARPKMDSDRTAPDEEADDDVLVGRIKCSLGRSAAARQESRDSSATEGGALLDAA